MKCCDLRHWLKATEGTYLNLSLFEELKIQRLRWNPAPQRGWRASSSPGSPPCFTREVLGLLFALPKNPFSTWLLNSLHCVSTIPGGAMERTSSVMFDFNLLQSASAANSPSPPQPPVLTKCAPLISNIWSLQTFTVTPKEHGLVFPATSVGCSWLLCPSGWCCFYESTQLWDHLLENGVHLLLHKAKSCLWGWPISPATNSVHKMILLMCSLTKLASRYKAVVLSWGPPCRCSLGTCWWTCSRPWWLLWCWWEYSTLLEAMLLFCKLLLSFSSWLCCTGLQDMLLKPCFSSADCYSEAARRGWASQDHLRCFWKPHFSSVSFCSGGVCYCCGAQEQRQGLGDPV